MTDSRTPQFCGYGDCVRTAGHEPPHRNELGFEPPEQEQRTDWERYADAVAAAVMQRMLQGPYLEALAAGLARQLGGDVVDARILCGHQEDQLSCTLPDGHLGEHQWPQRCGDQRAAGVTCGRGAGHGGWHEADNSMRWGDAQPVVQCPRTGCVLPEYHQGDHAGSAVVPT